MSKIRNVLQLYQQGRSKLFISENLSISRNTVSKYITLFELLKIDLEELMKKNDLELEILFFGTNTIQLTPQLKKLYSFFPYAERQLRKPGVTKKLLWEEYRVKHPEGIGSSQFYEHFNRWHKKVNPVMRIPHKAGDKLYLDYAGKTLSIVEKGTGEIKQVQVFVATLGSSQYTYAEASMSQQTSDFVYSLQRALHHFGGVPLALVPDNLKSAVTKSDKYEPTLNEVLLEVGLHYGTAILPARAYRPRDKALVEGAVKILYQRVFTKVQQNTYFDLKELNKDISLALMDHNSRLLTGRPYSRLQLFQEVEKKELKPLPENWYHIKSQQMATVMPNGHVLLSADQHYYSVPFQYIKKKVKILYNKDHVEIYYKQIRIAFHNRNYKKYDYTTQNDHMASAHQFVSDWSPQRFIDWAARIDPQVQAYISKVLEGKQHPEQAYRSCSGILAQLKKKEIGKTRLIKACTLGLRLEVFTYQMIKKILENRWDELGEVPVDNEQLPSHSNIRGKNYYQ